MNGISRLNLDEERINELERAENQRYRNFKEIVEAEE